MVLWSPFYYGVSMRGDVTVYDCYGDPVAHLAMGPTDKERKEIALCIVDALNDYAKTKGQEPKDQP